MMGGLKVILVSRKVLGFQPRELNTTRPDCSPDQILKKLPKQQTLSIIGQKLGFRGICMAEVAKKMAEIDGMGPIDPTSEESRGKLAKMVLRP